MAVFQFCGRLWLSVALEEAIRGCTTIISCVGSVRPSNLWTDFLAMPLLRILRKDVSTWCRDRRHPYFVHFKSTQKALAYAEREQMRRETAAELEDKDDDNRDESSDPSVKRVPRIRFIRISDLCVTQKAWNLIPLLTNALHSMVFRYQDMTEKILSASTLIDTVILRPGDLVDDERDVNTTSLQVSAEGWVPCPSRVSREDVASLAVAASLFDTDHLYKRGKRRRKLTGFDTTSHSSTAAVASSQQALSKAPFHYTLAVRWAGQQLHPYPPQGHFKDGKVDANVCIQAAMKQIQSQEKQERRHRDKPAHASKPSAGNNSSVARFARRLPTVRRGRMKPYGVCVAIPVYFMLIMMSKALLRCVLPHVPGQGWIWPHLLQMGSLVTLATTSVVGRIRTLLSRLPLGRGAQEYISF